VEKRDKLHKIESPRKFRLAWVLLPPEQVKSGIEDTKERSPKFNSCKSALPDARVDSQILLFKNRLENNGLLMYVRIWTKLLNCAERRLENMLDRHSHLFSLAKVRFAPTLESTLLSEEVVRRHKVPWSNGAEKVALERFETSRAAWGRHIE